MIIVDYDIGNLRSVQKGFEKVGVPAIVSGDPEVISNARALTLPGVGAFAECMDNLEKYGLTQVVKDFIGSGRPFLGICVGYQMLFEESEEFGNRAGLGVIKGKCARFGFNPGNGLKIPHMGWNQISMKNSGKLFNGIEDKTDFYFVHSYYPVPEEEGIVTATTEYGGEVFAASIEHGSVFATQFHPEKSQRVGLMVLENFARVASL